jgi:hypothetical protein
MAVLQLLAIAGYYASLRRAFAVWLKKVLLPARLPGVELPELADLNEVNTMLAERVMEWTRQWYDTFGILALIMPAHRSPSFTKATDS